MTIFLFAKKVLLREILSKKLFLGTPQRDLLRPQNGVVFEIFDLALENEVFKLFCSSFYEEICQIVVAGTFMI